MDKEPREASEDITEQVKSEHIKQVAPFFDWWVVSVYKYQ
jgi:hypothetical protein